MFSIFDIGIRFGACGGMLMLASCQMATSQKIENETFYYKITENGAPDILNEVRYESLGDHTFNKVQKYKIIARTESARVSHFLVVDIKKKVGGKVISDDAGVTIPVRDGVAEFSCGHYFDVKLTVNANDTADVVCTFQPIGSILINAQASFKEPPSK